MAHATRILLVHQRRSRFVRADSEILGTAFTVRELRVASPVWPPPWTIATAVARTDLIFCWFASWHAVLPLAFARVLRRPSIVVVGGYDVAAVPEIAYGNQRGGARTHVARWVMRSATRVCAFSSFARDEAQRNAGIPSDRIATIPLGVEGADADVALPRERLVMTVADVDRSNFRRKGLDRFARASREMPEISFVLVGSIRDDSADELKRIGGPNLKLLGRVSDDELADLYRRASAYLQLSLHEGFGLAVAEAMSAGCVPVVTRAGALPEVVGDAGEYVDDPTPTAVAAAVHRATADPERGWAAGARIRSEFPLSRRRDALVALVGSMLR